MSFLTNLAWRYATKKFDTTKKVSSDDLDTILEAIRMTPTSYGLQPYRVYVVENQEKKAAIQAASWNQPQVSTSSHLLVFVARTDLLANKDEFFDLISGGDAGVRANLKGYEDMVIGSIGMHTAAGTALHWAAKQAYIAQGFALAACAELEIDSCPMEGFDPSAVDGILGLPETEKSVFLLPIGYRAPDESPRPKARFSKEVLFRAVK